MNQIGFIARRSIRRTLRQPALIIPTIVFSLSVSFMQGALFAATTAGAELATDIETGFLNRLALTPLRGIGILVGQLAGAVFVSLLASLVYLGVGLLAGAQLEAGVGGAVVLFALATLIGVAFGAIGLFMALRTGSAEAVQGLFPLMFVVFFLSSINLPRNLIQTTWFRDVATYNPVSYLVEGIRSLVITGWDAEALALGFGIAAGLAAIAFAGAASALRTRLTRT